MRRENGIDSIARRGACGVPAGVIGIVVLVLAMTGCAGTSDQVLPTELKSRVVSATGTVDDHMAAAKIYEHHAQRLLDEATQFEQQASTLADTVQADPTGVRPDRLIQVDPTGVRRDRLMMVAQERRAQAAEMHRLYAMHYLKATTTSMTAKQEQRQ